VTRDFVVNDTVGATGIGIGWPPGFAYVRINQISTNVVNNFSGKLSLETWLGWPAHAQSAPRLALSMSSGMNWRRTACATLKR